MNWLSRVTNFFNFEKKSIEKINKQLKTVISSSVSDEKKLEMVLHLLNNVEPGYQIKVSVNLQKKRKSQILADARRSNHIWLDETEFLFHVLVVDLFNLLNKLAVSSENNIYEVVFQSSNPQKDKKCFRSWTDTLRRSVYGLYINPNGDDGMYTMYTEKILIPIQIVSEIKVLPKKSKLPLTSWLKRIHSEKGYREEVVPTQDWS